MLMGSWNRSTLDRAFVSVFLWRKWLGTPDGKRSRRHVIVAPNPFCPNQYITRSPENEFSQVVFGFAWNAYLVDPSSVSSPSITILLTCSIIQRTSSGPEAVQPVGFSCNLCRCRYARGRIRFTSITITICPLFNNPGFPMIRPTKPLSASPNPPCPQFVSSWPRTHSAPTSPSRYHQRNSCPR